MTTALECDRIETDMDVKRIEMALLLILFAANRKVKQGAGEG